MQATTATTGKEEPKPAKLNTSSLRLQSTLAVFLLVQLFGLGNTASIPTTKPQLEMAAHRSSQTPGSDISRMLKQVMEHYDKYIRPFYGVKPIDVTLDLLILSFGEIREADMEYSVDIYLGLAWQDPRLALGINSTLSLGGDFMEKFWIPDVFFVNSVHAEVHEMLLPNKKVWVDLKGGHIMLSARMKSIASCKMDLRKYPMDEQTCHLAMESFSYDKDDMTLKWKAPMGSDVYIYDEEMAQFTVISAKRRSRHKLYHSERFSGLTLTFKFERRTMYYIFQMYIPCVCIVALSWVSFWIDADAVPARVGLGITTVLTICYMLGHVNFNLPRVSYLKAIDYFLLLSFGFIFLTLIEYVFVLHYSRKIKYYGSFVPGTKPHNSLEEKWMDIEKSSMEVRITVGGKSYTFSDSVSNLNSSSASATGEVHQDMGSKKPIKVCCHKKPILRRNRQPEQESMVKSIKRKFRPGFGGNQIDKFSRFLFPFLYTMFLAIYFFCYSLVDTN